MITGPLVLHFTITSTLYNLWLLVLQICSLQLHLQPLLNIFHLPLRSLLNNEKCWFLYFINTKQCCTVSPIILWNRNRTARLSYEFNIAIVQCKQAHLIFHFNFVISAKSLPQCCGIYNNIAFIDAKNCSTLLGTFKISNEKNVF